jgi:hypothetical protein
MRLEQTRGSLRDFCERLFDLIEKLAGAPPQPLRDTGWYRAESEGKAFLWLRIVGERARTHPPNSVHLSAKWHQLLIDEGAVQGNNWFGQPSADVSARLEESVLAENFIRCAFQLYGHRSGAS